MRVIQTFVLRLFIDTVEPQALRGSLISVAQGDEHMFSDRASFLDLLDQIIDLSPEPDQSNENGMQTPARPDREEGVGNG